MEGALKDIQDARKEAYSQLQKFLINAERDQKVALGDQWEDQDKTKLNKEGRPVLNINMVGKGCRVISAQQRQNPMDLVYYPVDGTDQEGSDVYTKVNKWLFRNGEYAMIRNLAFDDTVHTGIGWMAPEMCYDYDPLYGDIILNHESIYAILPDPYLTRMDLEDCDYMIRQKYLSKNKCIALWPEFKNDINDLTGGKSNESTRPIIADENKLYVTEKWRRNYEDTIILINPQTLQSLVWKEGIEALKAMIAQDPRLASMEMVKRRVPAMKLQISINDTLLIHDGDVPEGYSRYRYPFIPIWGFFTPHYNESSWDLKLSGYARALIDSQREKNKTRSILMDGLMRSVRNKIYMEQGALENPDDLTNMEKSVITVMPGSWDKWKEATPPVIDAAMIQLEQMHSQDIKEMGLNPDMLMIEGGSAASAPTSSLQLRMKQSMMGVQQLFDNLGLANRMLGLYNVDLINTWPKQKIEKIIGQPVPQDWDQRKENTRYDCIVDEKTSSPTYRQSVYQDILGIVQHGGIKDGVPPVVMRQIIDLPADIRKVWDQADQQQTQQAQQMQKLEMQMQQQAMQIELQKEQIKLQGELLKTKMQEEGDDARLDKQLITDLAIAKLKNNQKTKEQ
jgi:hypothetical protein